MKNNIQRILFALLLLFTFGSCNDNEVKQQMVDFDRAFIPAFYYTYIGDMQKAETAMYPVNAKWQKFKQHYNKHSYGNTEWDETIHMVNNWLEFANSTIREKDADQALIFLDHARYELSEIRWKEGITNYYLDDIWELESSIDVIIQTSNDPMIDLLEWNQFKELCTDLEVTWQRIVKQQIDADLFQLNPNQVIDFNYRKRILNNQIDELMTAVESADRCQFAEAALNLEPAYLNLVIPLGNFEATETYFALRNW